MRTLTLCIALLSPVAFAAGDPEAIFSHAKASAETLGGLGPFLDSYAAECDSIALGGGECLSRVAAFRKKATGKKYFMVVPEESSLVSVGQIRGDDVQFLVTPFFGAAGSAVTHGSPSRMDKDGNPVLPFIIVNGRAPEMMNAGMIQRLASTRGLRLQVVFTPTGTWQLKKPGGKTVTGVKARVSAILVSVARTGQAVGVWTSE